MAKKSVTESPPTREYQARELSAIMCELFRAAWFIADISKILSEKVATLEVVEIDGTTVTGID